MHPWTGHHYARPRPYRATPLQEGGQGPRQIIPSSWIADISRNGDRDAWKNGEFAAAFGSFTMSYRSGWYIVENEPGYEFAMGIYGQNLFIDRANQLVIAQVSSQAERLDLKHIALAHAAVAEIRKGLIR